MAPPRTTAPLPKACQAIAGTMIGHFITRLEVEAGKAGGALSAERIRELAQHWLEHEQARFAATYQRSWDDCTRERETRSWEASRRHPFDRILMKRFAHLFPARSGDDGGTGTLSRRMIPGFDVAIDKMIGPTLYEQCQKKSQAIIDRHALPQGGMDWEAIYADPEANALANDVLVVMAHYFADFDKRRAWFMALVNSHLGPALPGAPDEYWQFGESAFSALMHALFGDLQAAVATRPDSVRARYGDQTFETLKGFFARLKAV
ncbi:MAG: hypothetical protein ACM31L_10335 [Actinomycetota bacterium]